MEWSPAAKWLISTQARYVSRQFEDDQNALPLAPFTVFDAALVYDLNEKVSASLKVENLFNTEIETGKSASGLISIGAPRLVTVQVHFRL